MRAYVNTAKAANPVEIRDVDEPRPKDNEAVVAVKAFSLNRGELALIASRPEGWRPGQDIAGVVVRQAADGSGPGSGTNVYGLVEGAGWSERVAVPVSSLSERPDELSEIDGAALPLAGLTALRTLRLGGSLLGQRVLITGATGGVGHLQVQLAHLGGAEVMPVQAAEKHLGGHLTLSSMRLVESRSKRRLD